MNVSLDSICRLCASKDGGFKIDLFDQRLGYIDKVTRFIPLEIPEDDDLPSKICYRCAMLLNDFEKFCSNCIQVQETLSRRNNNNLKESSSEKLLDPEPKSNNTEQGTNIPDDDDDDDASEADSNDNGTLCSEMDASTCQSDQDDSNRKVWSGVFGPNENATKPSHLKETLVPLPGSTKSSQIIYTCEYCAQMFTSRNIAYTHECPNLLNNCKRNDLIEPSNSYTCELCYQVFSRQAVLQAHRVGHMNNSSGDESGDDIYDENSCVFGQKRKKKRRGSRVPRDGFCYKPFFQPEEEEDELEKN